MSNIRTYLAQILSARYGKDVRQAIHDSIKEIDSVARTAKDSATSASQTAIEQASQAVSASQIAVQKADESLAASEQAKMYAENASAVTGIEIAKVDRAGIIKGGDNHIAEDGTLTLTKQTTGKTLDNSYSGGIKVNEIGGKSEQQTTTGVQLFEFVKGLNASSNGINVKDNGDGTLSIIGKATANGGVFALGSAFSGSDIVYSLPSGDYYVSGMPDNLMLMLYRTGDTVNSVAMTTDGKFTLAEDTSFCSVSLRWYKGAVFNEPNAKVMLNAGTTALPWEPHTGGKASPSPDYQQEIKAVTGKNLLDCRGLVETTTNGITYTPVYDADGNLKYVDAHGTATQNSAYALGTNEDILADLPHGHYILSGCPVGGSQQTYYLRHYNFDSANPTYSVADHGYGKIYTFNNKKGEHKVQIYIVAGTIVDHLRFYPMIRPASITDNTYVPYGCLRVKTCGKNLFNPNEAINKASIGLKNGTTYSDSNSFATNYMVVFGMESISWSGKSNSTNFTWGCFYNREKELISSFNGAKNTVIVPSGAYYVRIGFLNEYFDTLIVNEGNVLHDYEPYQEKSITLSNPITLNGIGDVKDRFVREDGVWGVERRLLEVVFDGSGDELIGYESGSGRLTIDSIKDSAKPVINNDEIANIMCDSFTADSLASIYGGKEGIALSVNCTLSLRDSSLSSLAEWKTRLAEKPIKVIYEANNPIFEPLPTADQIALNSLASFDGVTYLYFDSEIEPTSLVEYGTSKVGGYTLDAWNKAENNRIRMEEVTMAMLSLNQE